MKDNFELEVTDRHMLYSRWVNDLYLVMEKDPDPKQQPFYTGSCFHFYNHLSCHHAAVLQYAEVLPTIAKKISQEKQGRRKRQKTGLQHVNKCHLRKMAEEHARLSCIDGDIPPRTIQRGNQAMCYPVSQTEESSSHV